MRDIKSIEDAKLNLKFTKAEAAISSLPPGYLLGFRLRTENNQLIVGKGIMHVRSSSVYSKEERILDGTEYVNPTNIIPGFTYYVYMDAAKQIKVDSLEGVWDDEYFGYYHPSLFQFRYLGRFKLGANRNFSEILNQDPVVGNDINADEVTSLLMKTLMAQVTDFIVVGQGPGLTPTLNDVACFIYEDKIEIKKYNGSTWVVRQKFGDTTEIGNTMVIGSELWIGFHSVTGTSTYDAPGEGDTVHYISGTTDNYQEYTGGAWVVTANGIKIGGFVGGLFLAMIGATGLYHPSNPPTSTELLPNPNFRVFNFNGDYADQFSVDDWGSKPNVAVDTNIKKFGTSSLWATSGNYGVLIGLASGTQGQSQSVAGWFYASHTGGGAYGAKEYSNLISVGAPGGNYITCSLIKTASSDELKVIVTVAKNNSVVLTYTYPTAIVHNTWNYVSFNYHGPTDTLYTVLNNTITNHGVMGGSWTGGTLSLDARSARAYTGAGYGTYDAHIDGLLYYYNKYLDPNLLVQHYNHDVAWDTAYSRADILLKPNTDGRIILDGPIGRTLYSAALQATTMQTIEHGLGVDPTHVEVDLYCITAEIGFSVGDTARPCSFQASTGINYLWALSKDSTNIYIKPEANQLYVLRKDTGALALITMAKWKWKIQVSP